MDDQHVYHHSDSDFPKAEKNTKGFNFEAHVQGCKTVDQAMAMLKDATAKLEAEYGVKA